MPSGAVDLAQEPIRHLDQDAGAVAGVGLAAAGAAVLQVDQDLQAALDDAVRRAALDVDDEADAAGVVLVAPDRRVRPPAGVLQMTCWPFPLRELSQADGQKGNRMITSDP